ncbi:MAG: carbohydrate kinase family protein [Spirochaetaceae bacterium]|nr:carbohydrate kinase family protein [Spirochaetaceae bacterium]
MTTIHGTGCSLMDYLYVNVDLSSPAIKRAMSRTPGDGGLAPGKLVFLEDLERFSGQTFAEFLKEATDGREPDKANLGGPSVVSLINAAQLLGTERYKVGFFGGHGDDETARQLLAIIGNTPLDFSGYKTVEGMTPFTVVLSDPSYDEGHGERTFVNNLGAAWNYGPADVPDSFFNADIVAFGGTALLPRIHDSLASLAVKGKKAGATVVVNTVYDYRSQAKDPTGRWALGKSDETYASIDVLVADREEAFRLSGETSIDGALAYFKAKGTGAAVVTDGAREIHFYSDGALFSRAENRKLPVSAAVKADIADPAIQKGDTTGCGDNFAGGLLASMAEQMDAGVPRGSLDLAEACSWAVASGGFSCFHIGGTYLESKPGEKRAKIGYYYDLYKKQTGRGR